MKVSVLMITYNHEAYIEEAIKGVLMQNTTFDVELIICNDCSSDNTDKVIKSCLKYDSIHDIKYHKHEKNLGMSKNFEFAFNQSKGDYIAICEGDDYWIDTLKLQKQVDFLKNKLDFSFCWTRFKTLNQNTQKLTLDFNQKYYKSNEGFIDFDFETSYKGWHIGNQTLVFRKPYFDTKSFNEFKYFKDVHLIAQLLKKGKGACLNFVGAVYRIHDEGIHTSVTPFNGYKIGYLTHKEIYMDNKSNPFLKKKYLLSYKNYLNALIRENYLKKALWISFDLLFKNGQFVEFLRHLKRIVVKFTANEK